MSEKRKALVLGATGMVGRPLAESLVESGWSVIGAARLSDPEVAQGLAQRGVAVLRFEATTDDPADLPDVDAVFLEVWDPSDASLTWPINFHGVGRVVERYAGAASIVNGSTINVYGDKPEAGREGDLCRPTSDYGASRLAQEHLIDYFCTRAGSKVINVRYAHSNTARRGMVRRLAETVRSSGSLGSNPDARLQVIALEDFVRVTRLALDRAASPSVAVNCCHPRVWTCRELAEELRRRLGRGAVVFDRDSGGAEHSAYADASRMVEWFGPPTVGIDTLIDRVINDMKG